jgi:hypothetical protein
MSFVVVVLKVLKIFVKKSLKNNCENWCKSLNLKKMFEKLFKRVCEKPLK